MKRFLYYFGWTLGIGFIIYLGMKYQFHLAEEGKRNFELLPTIRFAALFPVFIGLLLRLPKLIIEKRQNKRWTFDWIKFTAVGLPSLYIVIMSILPYSTLGQGKIRIPEIILIGSPAITTIAGIVFGYIVLDSLKK